MSQTPPSVFDQFSRKGAPRRSSEDVNVLDTYFGGGKKCIVMVTVYINTLWVATKHYCWRFLVVLNLKEILNTLHSTLVLKFSLQLNQYICPDGQV